MAPPCLPNVRTNLTKFLQFICNFFTQIMNLQHNGDKGTQTSTWCMHSYVSACLHAKNLPLWRCRHFGKAQTHKNTVRVDNSFLKEEKLSIGAPQRNFIVPFYSLTLIDSTNDSTPDRMVFTASINVGISFCF